MNEESVIEEFEELYKDITLLEFNKIEDRFKTEYEKVKNQTNTRLIKRYKKLVFSLHMADYKKEKIWEFLNGDMPKGAFDYFVDAVHKGWFK